MKYFTQKFIGLLALVFAMSFTVNAQEIGDVYQGGYIFQINEDGTGLVADLQDLGEMNWDDAMAAAENSTSQGYDDWYLPSIEELELIYSTIGLDAAEGASGFVVGRYWSSSEGSHSHNNFAWSIYFGTGLRQNTWKYNSSCRVRVIRAF